MTRRIKTPDLVRKEAFAGLLGITVVLLISAGMDAPIGGPADPTGIPAADVRAPWIFIGIQKILRYLPAMLGGVIIPGAAALALICIPFLSQKNKFQARFVFWTIIIISLLITLWAYLF